jgi:hypothetical protein
VTAWLTSRATKVKAAATPTIPELPA